MDMHSNHAVPSVVDTVADLAIQLLLATNMACLSYLHLGMFCASVVPCVSQIKCLPANTSSVSLPPQKVISSMVSGS